MNIIAPTERQIQTTLSRLLPRLEKQFSPKAKVIPGLASFSTGWRSTFHVFFDLYFRLYSDQYDFFFHLEDLVITLAKMWLSRPADLQALDDTREADSAGSFPIKCWRVAYVDLFAGDLEGIRQKIPYFKELGMTYLHLMPLFLVPEGENDGGYAVSSYRKVNLPSEPQKDYHS